MDSSHRNTDPGPLEDEVDCFENSSPHDSVDTLTELSEEADSPESAGSKHEDERCPDGQKRKRRKKRMLTGVSRQRRAANARERRRIQGVNRAFVDLKNTLPLANVDISKIEILHFAVKWIDHLGTLLKDYEEHKEQLNTRQLETSKPSELISITGENIPPMKHDCLYHQFPDLKNTLWEECIGLQGKRNNYMQSYSPIYVIAIRI